MGLEGLNNHIVLINFLPRYHGVFWKIVSRTLPLPPSPDNEVMIQNIVWQPGPHVLSCLAMTEQLVIVMSLL